MSAHEATASGSVPNRNDVDSGADNSGALAEPPDPRRWPLASRIIRVVGFALLLVPIMLDHGWPGDLLRREALGSVTIVVGDWVPSLRGPAGWCLALGVLAILVAPLLGPWGQGRRSVIAMRVVSPLALGAVVLSAVGAYFGVWVAQESFRVLDQMSADGCRVVVGAHGAGFQGLNRSYGLVRPGSDRVEWVIRESYSDQGAHEIEVTWDGEVGRLRSDTEAQITPQLAPVRFDCGD
ncbi:hypothetical protein [Agrococcus sp. KRD186]|uniref:hypothetical protein n=1 Tax=Agrococcus sp. KRD186 TaxID=2729730 RepID=UPI0019D1CA89|nr:hypothetical protein [Agrococcus sp. KRD186]